MFLAHQTSTPHLPHGGSELLLITIALGVVFAVVLVLGFISSRKF